MTDGPERLYEMLKEVDPESSREDPLVITPSASSGHWNIFIRPDRRFLSTMNRNRRKESPYNFAYFVLNRPREVLYERIDQRVDQMMEEGLVQEVRKLKDRGYDRSLVSMQGLGYKEILAYFDGELSLEEAVYILKRDTRHFAKRQLTWFKRERDVLWLDQSKYDSRERAILADMIHILRQKGIID